MAIICVGKLTIIVSDNGLSHGQAIIWNNDGLFTDAIIWSNAGILLIWTLGTNVGEILIEIQTFSVKIKYV